MRILAWISLLAALGTSAVIWWMSPDRYQVRVVARGPSSAHRAAQPVLCPPGSLPDEGVCIPVPRRDPEIDAQIPKLPERPDSLEAYRLPFPSAHLGSWSDLAALDQLHNQGPVLITSHEQGAQVPLVDVFFPCEPELVAKGTNWLLIGYAQASSPKRYVGLYGPLHPDPKLTIGEKLRPSTRLGTAPESLGFSLFELRASHDFDEGQALLEASRSVSVDVRNLLPLASERSPAMESAPAPSHSTNL